VKKYAFRWTTQIGPALVAFVATVKWADSHYEQSFREHWD
jgi:hypothetical protein